MIAAQVGVLTTGRFGDNWACSQDVDGLGIPASTEPIDIERWLERAIPPDRSHPEGDPYGRARLRHPAVNACPCARFSPFAERRGPICERWRFHKGFVPDGLTFLPGTWL